MAGFHRLRYALAFLVLTGTFRAAAQDPSFQASVDRNPVGVGEELTISFTLANAGTGGGKNFKLPDLSRFRTLSGPNQSTSMQFMNGAMSSSVTYSCMVQARDAGKYSIGPATIDVGGKTLRTNPIVLDVVKNPQRAQQSAPDNAGGQIAENVFLRAIVSKTHVMQGEQINLSFKLYTRLTVMNYAVEKTPTMTGFWGEDVETPKDVQLSTETVNGKQYRVGIIKRTALFPTQSGSLEISPMTLQTQIQMPAPRSVDPFDAFFRDPFGRTTNYAARSEPVKVMVDPLPGGAPPDFKGAVGQFAMSTSVDKKTTRTNEPVSLKVTVSGTGNIKLLEAPALELPADFEQYSPKVQEIINRQGERITGSKVFEYLLIPRYPGMKVIKPVTFSYFDLNRREYIRLRSPEIELNVEQGTAPAVPLVAGGGREDVRLLNQDIRFIKVRPAAFVRQGEYLYNSSGFVLLLLLPLAGAAGAYVYASNRRAALSDVAGYRNRRAIGEARKRLKTGERLLRETGAKAGGASKSAPRFFSETAGALWQYLGDKLGIPQAEFSVERAAGALADAGTPAPLVQALRTLLETCDMARFAPTSVDRPAMQRAYEEASRIIVELERTLNAQ
jgi:hypothetical protein